MAPVHMRFVWLGQMAKVLLKLGVRQGDRVGTLAWNTYRHMEVRNPVAGGAVPCPLNPAPCPLPLDPCPLPPDPMTPAPCPLPPAP